MITNERLVDDILAAIAVELTCVHAAVGLCPTCQADFDEDPSAYWEFGEHPQGIANWKAEEALMLRDANLPPPTAEIDPTIPF